jgi:hypothetical protein
MSGYGRLNPDYLGGGPGKPIGEPQKGNPPQCQSRGGPEVKFSKSKVGLRNSRAVVVIPPLRCLILGHKAFAPSCEAGLRLFHQSGHDDLHMCAAVKLNAPL